MFGGLALVLPVLFLLALLPLGHLDPQASEQLNARVMQHFLQPWLILLKGVLIYPVIEECLYRGLILQLLRRYVPLWVAVAGSTALFALTHLGPSLGSVAFAAVGGAFLAWLAVRTGSLLPGIVAHAAMNFGLWFVFRPVLLAADHPPTGVQLDALLLALLASCTALLIASIRILRSGRPSCVAPLVA